MRNVIFRVFQELIKIDDESRRWRKERGQGRRKARERQKGIFLGKRTSRRTRCLKISEHPRMGNGVFGRNPLHEVDLGRREHKGEGSTERNEGTRMDTKQLAQLSSVIYVSGSAQGFDEETLVKKEKDE
jgi:hypothetical protein